MRILLDTNIIIAIEPVSEKNLEEGTDDLVRLLNLISKGNHKALIHPSIKKDFASEKDHKRKEARELLVKKYEMLENPPKKDVVEGILGMAKQDSHDEIDYELLAAVFKEAVHILVSNDFKLIQKAKKLGLSERVLDGNKAINLLERKENQWFDLSPDVESGSAHQLNEKDTIFDSIREDYQSFDEWFSNCKKEGRRVWWITRTDSSYAGVAIFKDNDLLSSYTGKGGKLCTFKVSEQSSGNKYGELLLKTIFSYCDLNNYDYIYVTVREKYKQLIAMLENFGFGACDYQTATEDTIYVKKFKPGKDGGEEMTSLEYHIKFGPPALKTENVKFFVIPIYPDYHKMLFPELDVGRLPISSHPSGNALRKAYLCHANINNLDPGSILLFYRSHDQQSVSVIGVLETAWRTKDPDLIWSTIGNRTVYTYNTIDEMTKEKTVLVLEFRQDRILKSSISLKELEEHNVLNGAPQSIQGVKDGHKWLVSQIGQ
jgi:L-amino acid N-acyltransferase YncA/rRNA-processing protein FCF1